MPDVQEVFRLATNKVKPDPNALERQQRRQRASTRSSRARAYLVVAAVIAVVAVGVLAIMRMAEHGEHDVPADSDPPVRRPSRSSRRFPPARTRKRRRSSIFGAIRPGQVTGMPVDAFAPSVSADGSTIAFVAAPSELGYNQIGVMGADGSDPHFISTPHVIVGATVAISPDASKVAFEGLTTGTRRYLRGRRRRDGRCDS